MPFVYDILHRTQLTRIKRGVLNLKKIADAERCGGVWAETMRVTFPAPKNLAGAGPFRPIVSASISRLIMFWSNALILGVPTDGAVSRPYSMLSK